MNETFGKRLRILRIEKKLSQIQLAKELRIGKSVISLWERDECEPTLNNLISVARFFDVSMDYLAGIKDY